VFQDSTVLQRFIVIEGIDGAGTSTQRQILCKNMSQIGVKVHETFEPTDSSIGQIIRRALRHEISLNQGTLCRLFAADRHEHCHGKNGIVELCQSGTYVVSDRYLFSSIAYQGLSQDIDWIVDLNRGFPLPEYFIFVDIDPELAKTRREIRGEAPELFDADPIQVAVRKNYHAMIESLRKHQPLTKICYLEGHKSITEISNSIWNFLEFPPI
jgi:dTMP kinase